jgi:hypothetical protein
MASHGNRLLYDQQPRKATVLTVNLPQQQLPAVAVVNLCLTHQGQLFSNDVARYRLYQPATQALQHRTPSKR